MNPDICKKCHKYWCIQVDNSKIYINCGEKDKTYYKFNNFELDDFKFKMNYDDFCKIFKFDKISPLKFFYFKIKTINKFMKKSLKKIKISKTCPYYIEHQISDWSKENDI
ncbi:MAG: hypothetical protein IKP65_05430 [Alphaproteobacteria bacterium]|nr:hypothetical protein [Alphaproteobacteria bacterium]